MAPAVSPTIIAHAFRTHGIQRVWIADDRDDAGEKATLALSEELLSTGIECFRVLFPRHGRQRVRAQGDAGSQESRTTRPYLQVAYG